MKNFLQYLIEELVDARLKQDIGTTPTTSSRAHTFRGPRLGGIKKDGSLGKVSRVRKDTSAAYIAGHPMKNPYIAMSNRVRLSDLQVQQLFNVYKYKVNVRDIKAGKVSKSTWSLGNNKQGVKIQYDKQKKIFYKIVDK